MKLIIGNDHAGVNLKNAIVAHLTELGHEVTDIGIAASERADYPDVAEKLALQVADKTYELGILVCGTGIGMSMAANRISGVRAAATSSAFGAKFTRAHNNANVLCLGERILGEGEALQLVDLFITTPFDVENPRHQNRIDKIDAIDKKYKGE